MGTLAINSINFKANNSRIIINSPKIAILTIIITLEIID